MILGCQLFIRGLIHQNILRPRSKDVLKRLPQKFTPKHREVLLLLASILYHIVMGAFRVIPIVPNNQMHLGNTQIMPGQPLFAGKHVSQLSV